MSLTLILNGQERGFDTLHVGSDLSAVVQALEIKPDRVAVELNGEIVPRTGWADARLANHDKLEIVHFVGGG